jgi:hypothetical protein
VVHQRRVVQQMTDEVGDSAGVPQNSRFLQIMLRPADDWLGG